MLQEIGDDEVGILFRRTRRRVNDDLRTQRHLIRVINAGEVLDLTGAGEPVQAFCVACFADLERRINKDFDETGFADQRAALVARGPVRADRGAD